MGFVKMKYTVLKTVHDENFDSDAVVVGVFDTKLKADNFVISEITNVREHNVNDVRLDWNKVGILKDGKLKKGFVWTVVKGVCENA